MHFALNEDQIAVRDMARDFAAQNHANEIMRLIVARKLIEGAR